MTSEEQNAIKKVREVCERFNAELAAIPKGEFLHNGDTITVDPFGRASVTHTCDDWSECVEA